MFVLLSDVCPTLSVALCIFVGFFFLSFCDSDFPLIVFPDFFTIFRLSFSLTFVVKFMAKSNSSNQLHQIRPLVLM